MDDTRSLTMEFDLSHSPAKVWRALTEPELVSKWLMATADMKLAVGHPFTFKMPPMGGWDGVVNCGMKEIEPQKKLSYTWESMGLTTTVTWTLTASSEGGTLLKLEQAGFPTKGPAQYFEGAKMGWDNMAGKRLPEILAQIA